MVNGWLKSRPLAIAATKRAHFRHESCVNQQKPTPFARSEVVLDQAILGLLINGRQVLPWGIKE
jgi:hypothetical protein